jgi:hypothetical protein
MPLSRKHFEGRLALFQSIGLVAMYNMAYGRDCKLQNGHSNGLQRRPGSTWRMLFAEQMPLSRKHFKGRLALFQSIGLVAMYNMAYEAFANCKMDITMVYNVGQVPPGECSSPNKCCSRQSTLKVASLCSKASTRMPCTTWPTRRLQIAKWTLQWFAT